jgi:protein-disulfide isomerase
MKIASGILVLVAGLIFGAAQAADAPKRAYYEFVLGNPNAKLTVVEYASVTCPHCAKFFVETFPLIKKDYIDTGKIKYVYRDLPTPPRELSFAASQLARCVPNNKGMNMIEMLFKHQQEWMSAPDTTLRGYAQLAGMSSADFDSCLKDQAIYKELNDAVERATTTYKVESTPTFFVGETRVAGEQYEPLKKAIDKALGQ